MSRSRDDLPAAPTPRLSVACSGLGVGGPFTALGTPEGDYSRVCWLPVLGPTTWVLWGTLARRLDDSSIVGCDIDELTEALGLGRTHRLVKAVKRLGRLGLASSPASNPDGVWALPAMSPPLPPRHHATVSAAVRRFHHNTIANLADADQHVLWEIFTSTYIDHFGRQRY